MKIRRIFLSNFELFQDELILSKEDSRRILQVLRLKKGDVIEVFWNTENDYLAEVIKCLNKKVHLKIKEKIEKIEQKEEVSLAQSIIKPVRMDWLIEKVAEVGFWEFHPIISEYSIMKSKKEELKKKWERWKKIIISAAEQSGKSYIPELKNIKEFSSSLIELKKKYDIIFFCNKAREAVDIDAEKAKKKIKESHPIIFIGPEGGWSDKEIKLARENNVFFIKLKNYILRAETAAIVALSIIKHIKGQL